MEETKKKKYRGFNKSNLLNWLITLEKYGYVMCSFKNCIFMAFDIEEMADHYSRCDSDKSNIKYTCEYCGGGTEFENNLLKHKVLHHPQFADYKDFSRLNDRESELFPRSSPGRQASYVLQRSWQVFLDNRKYIKCLVQTCLYVAGTLDQMLAHFNNYCTPHYREQFVHTCLTCQGRTDNESDLKKHREIAHVNLGPDTNIVTDLVMQRWSDHLGRYRWAKCYNKDCNFIDYDIGTLKAHYKMCIEPSKDGYVECSKCRGWLNGFARLRKHIKMIHDPLSPQPSLYMDPHSAERQTPSFTADNNFNLSDVNSDQVASPDNTKNRSNIFDVSPIKACADDIRSAETELIRVGDIATDRSGLNTPPLVTEKRYKITNAGSAGSTSDEPILQSPNIQDGVGSTSTDELWVDLDESRLSFENTKVYSRAKTPAKKLPRYFAASVPKTTRSIDCCDAPRYRVTFPRDMLQTDEWKLEMPFVTMKNRVVVRKKKQVGALKSKEPAAECDAGPVTIRIDRADTSWTVRLPPSAFGDGLLSDFKKKTCSGKQVKEARADFKDRFWDRIESDMTDLLNLSKRVSSVRNSCVYHGYATRNNFGANGIGPDDDLFKLDVTEQEPDDPETELGISQDRDSDCDDLFADDPVDFPFSPETTEENCSASKTHGWCVKLVNRNETLVEENSYGLADRSVPYHDHKGTEEVCKANSKKHVRSFIEKGVDRSSVDGPAKTPPQASVLPANVDRMVVSEEASELSCRRSADKELPSTARRNGLNVSSDEDSERNSASDLPPGRVGPVKDLMLCKSSVEHVSSASSAFRLLDDRLISKDRNDSNDSWNDLIIDLRTENQKKTDKGKANSNVISDGGKNAKSDCDRIRPVFEGNGLDLTMKMCSREVVSCDDVKSVCSDGIHCGTDDENDQAQPEELPETVSDEGTGVARCTSHGQPISHDQNAKMNEKLEGRDFNMTSGDNRACDVSSTSNSRNHVEKSCQPTRLSKKRKKLKRKPGSSSSASDDNSGVVDSKKSCLPDGSAVVPVSVEVVTHSRVARPRRKRGAGTAAYPSGSSDRWSKEVAGAGSNCVDHDIIIPDCDVSAIEEHDPLPSSLIDFDIPADETQDLSLTSKTRKPKTKRSMDLMASLGDRITPNSALNNSHRKVTCALCLTTMTAAVYQSTHLVKHNFLCWLMDEMPLPLNDFNTMLLVANRGKRAHPNHVFKCEKCQRLNKSASGYLCHVRFCGKSKDEAEELMEACHLCSRLLKPNCVDQHMRMAHSSKTTVPVEPVLSSPPPASQCRRKRPESSGILSGEDPAPVTPEKDEAVVPVAKRVVPRKLMKSWKDALSKGAPLFCPVEKCDFSCDCYDTVQSHYRTCNPSEPTQTFSCKQCCFTTDSKAVHIAHMKNEHCIIVHLTENSAFYPIHFLKQLEDDIFCSFTWIRSTSVFKPCLQLTKRLRDKYCCNEVLYPDVRVVWEDWESMQDDNPAYQPDYLTSPAVRYNSTSDWLRLPCYSAATFKDDSLVWTGGCVRAMAWCPTPSDRISDQYLAVACLLNFSDTCTIGNVFQQPTCIQLWEYGFIHNSEMGDDESEGKMPRLVYGLCTDEGPIWDMDWCPSGCYDPTRLGLLACASAAGSVNVYALPHPSQLLIPSDRCPLFKGVASLKLLFSRNETYQCQAVSWSKVKPHKTVAGGFVNGLVALWDLSVTSTFLREATVLYPCRLFQAHHSSITCVKMCPVDNNFVVTGSQDKYIKVWDLRSVNHAVHCTVRGCITDLDWLTHWIAFGFGMDAGCTPTPSSAMLTSLRDFSFQPVSLLNLPNSSVMSISGNDWLNCFATGYDDGSVILTSCLRQFGDGSDAKKKISKLMVRTTVVDLAGEKKVCDEQQDTVLQDSSSYEDTINVFGISINTSKSFDDKAKMDSSNGEDTRNDVYPIHSVNKVCFNMNRQSFLCVAIGFNSGFVSLVRLAAPRQLTADIQQISAPNGSGRP